MKYIYYYILFIYPAYLKCFVLEATKLARFDVPSEALKTYLVPKYFERLHSDWRALRSTLRMQMRELPNNVEQIAFTITCV